MINSIQSKADISYLAPFNVFHDPGEGRHSFNFALSYLPILLIGFLTLVTSRELLLVQTNDIFPNNNQQNLLSVLTFKA